MTATATRPNLRDHVHPGVRVFHTTRHSVYRIIDLTDEDRSARLVARDGTRFRVGYGDLVRHYRLVQPF